jgi:hypothetical protein
MNQTTAAIPPRLRPFTRSLFVVLAVVGLAIFLISQHDLVQQPLRSCDSALSGCHFETLTAGDYAAAQQSGLPSALLFWSFIALSWIAKLSLPLVGVLLFLRRPDDWVAWAMALSAVTVIVEGAVQMGALQPVVDLVRTAGILAWMPLPFIFPNGRIEPRRLRWLVGLLWVVGVVAWSPGISPWLLSQAALRWLPMTAAAVWAVSSAASLAYRYRFVSNALERQQTKWVIAGFVLVMAVSTNYITVSTLFPPWEPSTARIAALFGTAVAYAAGYVGMAACMVFAVLRYRLWDIDLVIRRTLIYSTLTALLALLYLGTVTSMQAVFRAATGETSTAAIIISTLLLAALFQPLRRALQQAIDRRFYRRKYDTAHTLAAFAATARDSVDLDDLIDRLRGVVDETMQPAHSAVWLCGSAADLGPGDTQLARSASRPYAHTTSRPHLRNTPRKDSQPRRI